KNEPLGRPASPAEKGKEILADDSILDDATTMLAALRMGKSNWQFDQRLQALLASARLLSPSPAGRGFRRRAELVEAGEGEIHTEAVKNFLEASRVDALTMLHAAWMESDSFNELKLMPSLGCEGEWTNQPQETREFLLNLLD